MNTEFSFKGIEEQEVIGEVVSGVVTEAGETQDTGSGVQFTGILLHGEEINSEENTYIFNLTLEERRRVVIEGSFEQPVTFVLLAESYYSSWLRNRVVGVHNGYIKEPAEEFSIRTDINENAGGIYYFIIQSRENKINGEVKIFELAKL
jgi:hypothetical protein